MSKLAKFRLEALNAHNSYRLTHGVPLLEYDIELENSAQAYAEELVESDELRVSYGASFGVYGENISRRTGSAKRKPDVTGTEVTSLWYRDIEKFDYARGTGRASNFTQLIWRDTRSFGIGKAQAAGRVVVVAHYSPAGNVRGQFLENVPPPMPAQPGTVQLQRRSSKEAELEPDDPMLNYRVRARQVDTREVLEGRVAVVVRRELVEYEDREGRTKQKLVEERQLKVPRPRDEAENIEDTGSSGLDDDVPNRVSQSSRSSVESSIESKEPEATSIGAASSPRNSWSQTFQEKARKESRLVRNPAELQKFVKHVAAAVNHHRKRHDAKPLRVSGELCEMAQQLAEELAVCPGKLRPSSRTYRGQHLGQSLAARVSAANTEAPAEHVVGLWYAEGQKYNYSAEPSDIEQFGNFTQMVWKASQEIGLGRCTAQLADGSFKLVVACYYFPTGNVTNEFLLNVVPPKK